jgi:hypothetical protein
VTLHARRLEERPAGDRIAADRRVGRQVDVRRQIDDAFTDELDEIPDVGVAQVRAEPVAGGAIANDGEKLVP